MQFDIYQNMDKDSNKTYPYFVDIQTSLLDSLGSRAVIPLTPIKDIVGNYPKNLCPVIEVESKNFALLTHQITSVPVSLLKKVVGSGQSKRSEIVAALDFLATGI